MIMSCFTCGSSQTSKVRRPASVSPLLSRRQSLLDDKESYIAERTNNNSNPTDNPQNFTIQDLADATDNFSTECLVDVGSFGKVYKGKLRETGKVVVVEQLDRDGSRGNREFLVQVLMMSLLDHPNLINLVGYCAEGDERFLVHEYLPLGSLDQLLHDRSSEQEPLDWYSRMKIAMGIARGLEYIHNNASPHVIYRNLKPSNIFLDNDYNGKLSDFGLSKLGPSEDKKPMYTKVIGTPGYIAPEYEKTGLLTVKVDVYSFGVVLLELVTGRRAVDISRRTMEQNLVPWALQILKEPKKYSELADPVLEGKFPAKRLYEALVVAAMCLQEEPTARPMMSDVVIAIKYLSSDKRCDNAGSSREMCAEQNSTVHPSIQSQNTSSTENSTF